MSRRRRRFIRCGPLDCPLQPEEQRVVDRAIAYAKLDKESTLVLIRTDAAAGIPERVRFTLIVPAPRPAVGGRT